MARATEWRRLLPIGLKRWVKTRVLCHPAVGSVLAALFRDRIPAWGCRFDTSSKQITSTTKASLFWQSYEGAEIRFVRRYLRDDLDVVELGASLGVVSCQLRRKLKPDATLVAVEADPELVGIVEKNLALNAPGPVHLLNAAVDYGGSGELVAFSRGDASDVGRVDDGHGDYRVPRTSLREIFDRFKLKDRALVADIEGAEAGLIVHDPDAVSACRQIVIELHDTVFEGRRVEPDQMLAQLRELGFELLDRQGNVCVLERRT